MVTTQSTKKIINDNENHYQICFFCDIINKALLTEVSNQMGKIGLKMAKIAKKTKKVQRFTEINLYVTRGKDND